MSIRASIQQHPVASFIILTCALYGMAFLLPLPPESAFTAVILVDVAAPTIAALVLTLISDARRGTTAFLRQNLRWRAPLKWYGLALVIGFVIPLGSSLLALLTGSTASLQVAPPTAIFVLYPLFALLEDIGWRGFALRRLLDRFSPLTATLIVGLPWGLMHCSLGLVFQPEVMPVLWGLSVFAAAFPITWIFVKSGRNVLAAAGLHAAFNAFTGILAGAIPAAEVYGYLFAATALVGVVLVLLDWRMWFAQLAAQTGSVVPSTLS